MDADASLPTEYFVNAGPDFFPLPALPRPKHFRCLFGLSSFADENPNPVMRISDTGIILYANPAANAVLQNWNVQTGCELPRDLVEPAIRNKEQKRSDEIEVACDRHIHAFNTSAPEGKEYINLYGRDITSRKKAQQSQKESVDRQAALLEGFTEILAQADLSKLLQVIADAACRITDSKLAAAGHGFVEGQFRVSRASLAADMPPCPEGGFFGVEKGGVHMEVIHRVKSIRLTDAALRAHPAWWGLPAGHVPLKGLVAVRLVGRDSAPNGMILVSHKSKGHFTADDEAALNQLAAIASIALQNLEARVEAEARTLEAIQHQEDLARSNKELESFAYIASHDLQEPLRTIRSYLQLIDKRYKDHLDAEGREFIRYTSDGAARLQHLVQDLLTYSRVSTRAQPMRRLPATTTLREALGLLKQMVKESGAIITKEPLPIVKADGIQLTRVFQNLVENAIKFSHDGKPAKIHISARETGGEWVFSVRDNGIGIDPKFFERIFIVFQRLHTHAQYPGSGVGLTICKRIIERHGGRIWVESQPGEGTTFYFTLPKTSGP